MSEIIDLSKRRMELHGETMFITCGCGAIDGYQVVVVAGGDAPVIAGLVCNACGKEAGVCWGKVEKQWP